MQQTQEWFAIRIGKVTASNAGAILGHSPFRSRNQVMRKMVRDQLGLLSEDTANVATHYGVLNETLARVDFELETRLKVNPVGFIIHPVYEWLGASPDGLIDDDYLLEIKCPYGLRNDEEPEFKPVTSQHHYYIQVQLQMFCTGRKYCYFYQWTNKGSKLELVYFDQELIDQIMPKLQKFYMEFLEECKNPSKYIMKYSDDVEMIEACQKYKRLKQQAKEAEEEAKKILDEISEKMGADTSIGNVFELKYNTRKSVSYAKAIKDLLPNADLSEYETVSNFWTLK